MALGSEERGQGKETKAGAQYVGIILCPGILFFYLFYTLLTFILMDYTYSCHHNHKQPSQDDAPSIEGVSYV